MKNLKNHVKWSGYDETFIYRRPENKHWGEIGDISPFEAFCRHEGIWRIFVKKTGYKRQLNQNRAKKDQENFLLSLTNIFTRTFEEHEYWCKYREKYIAFLNSYGLTLTIKNIKV